jgi:hypothetical protein
MLIQSAHRYEIDVDGVNTWVDAEKQIRGGQSTVVSVKSNKPKKRTVEANGEEDAAKERKKKKKEKRDR